MKKLLGALLLSLMLVTSAQALDIPIYDTRTMEYGEVAELSEHDVWMAYGIALSVYGYATPPKQITLVTEFIFQSNIRGFYDLPNKTVWLNVTPREDIDKLYFLYVVIHEFGHHLLTERNVDVAQQHCLMYSDLDYKVLDAIGIEKEKQAEYINPMMALWACQY